MASNLPCSILESGSPHFEDIGIYLCDLELDSKKVKKEDSRDNIGAQKSYYKKAADKMRKKRQHAIKSFGRWRYREHYIYMQMVRKNLNHKDLIKALEHELPGRTVSQIRAHHQKMLYKFKGVGNLIRAYPDSTKNCELIEICNILDLALDKVQKIRGSLEEVFEKCNQIKGL